MDPRSPWAQEAAELIYKKLQLFGPDNVVHVTEEMVRLEYCIKTNSPVNTTWEIINQKRETLARKAACDLIEEEEAEKKRVEESKNKPSKRAAKKKAAKERHAAKTLAKLAPVEEDKEETFDVVDTPSEVQPASPSEVQPTPPMVDTGREAQEVFNLSDIGSALCCNDDSSTSVATALQCVICFKNERAVACVPCGHRALCEECGKKEVLREMKCPMCRADVMLFMRVWD